MASDKFTLKEICSEFDIKTDIEAYGNGHINDTYLCDTAPRFILQRLNTNVFKDPVSVMENIVNVTEHLSKKITAAGGDPMRETLTVIPTKSGCSYFKADENNYFRMYKFIEDSMSYDLVENPIQLYHAGTAFGKFQSMLSDFSADRLHETIVDFHNTPKRVEQLNDAISNNAANRADSVRAEIDFAKEYAKYASAVIDKMNDGSVLFDFGDALRFGASSGSEDETDLDKIWFDLEKFEQFAKGFLSQTADCLTDAEIELLPLSALLLTYECGIRFLADYLNGDTYFKIHRENHNLDRCRTQFKLVADIEKKLPQMAEIVKKYI